MAPRQASNLKLPFPLLCDYDGSVAKAYGTYLELEEQGGGTPRVEQRSKALIHIHIDSQCRHTLYIYMPVYIHVIYAYIHYIYTLIYDILW